MELLQTSLYIFLKEKFLGLLYEVLNAEGGIRTHEAVAVELKSTPFDRSGTSAFYIPPLTIYIYILISKYFI